METSFELFGLTGYRLGLFAAIGALVLFAAMLLLGRKRSVQPASVCVLMIMGMVLGVLFARLLYCLVNLADFVEAYENPWLMLRFFDGGLSLSGLLLGMLLAVPLTALLTREKAAELLDLLCVPMGLLFCALYLGQQDTGLGIGKIVEEGFFTQTISWLFLCERMGVNVEYRMLVYLYQAMVCLLIALVMIPVWLRAQQRPGFRSGETALVALAVYGASMVLLESLRDDGHMLMIFLRIGQVSAALLPIAAALVLLSRYRRLHGRALGRTCVTWLAILVFVAGIVVLEFALDGRLSLGSATPAHLYLLMAIVCVLMAWAAVALYGLVMREREKAEPRLSQ